MNTSPDEDTGVGTELVGMRIGVRMGLGVGTGDFCGELGDIVEITTGDSKGVIGSTEEEELGNKAGESEELGIKDGEEEDSRGVAEGGSGRDVEVGPVISGAVLG